MVTIRRSTPDGEEPGQQGSGVEKRLHPASARRSCAGNPCDGGAGAADAAACGDDDAAAAVGTIGSPVISHLSKGGRFAEHRERIILALLPETGPGCRALVPYTATLARSRRTSQQQRQQSSSRSPPPSTRLLALPPSSSPDAARHLEIPLEVFPVVFQYMDAPTLCSVSSVSREWRRQGNDDQYWRRLCQARFNVTPDAFAPPPDPIKLLYQLQYGSFKAMCRGCRLGFHSTTPSVSPQTSAQLLMGLMMSNAM